MSTRPKLLAVGMFLAATTAGCSQPVITNQPHAQATALGTTATFTVGATGVEPLAYQWQRAEGTGFLDLADGTNAVLTLTDAQPRPRLGGFLRLASAIWPPHRRFGGCHVLRRRRPHHLAGVALPDQSHQRPLCPAPALGLSRRLQRYRILAECRWRGLYPGAQHECGRATAHLHTASHQHPRSTRYDQRH